MIVLVAGFFDKVSEKNENNKVVGLGGHAVMTKRFGAFVILLIFFVTELLQKFKLLF